jgi:hypothetical protein
VAAKEPPRFDAQLKEVFQKDQPSLLESDFTGGIPVRESLNVELPKVVERRCDLLFRLQDDSLFLLDFQTDNVNNMPNRVGVYGLLANEQHGGSVSAMVLYTGPEPMRMPDRLDIDAVKVRMRLMDIRSIDYERLLVSGRPGDLVLAMLAGGGVDHLRTILQRVAALDPLARDRALAQMAVLSGLRRITERFTMEVAKMSPIINIDEHYFLRQIRDNGRAEGQAQGRAEGRAEGKAQLLGLVLQRHFGALPEWARARLEAATEAELDLWAERSVDPTTLVDVLGVQ